MRYTSWKIIFDLKLVRVIKDFPKLVQLDQKWSKRNCVCACVCVREKWEGNEYEKPSLVHTLLARGGNYSLYNETWK